MRGTQKVCGISHYDKADRVSHEERGYEGSDIAGDHIQDLTQPQPLEHQQRKENGREEKGLKLYPQRNPAEKACP